MESTGWWLALYFAPGVGPRLFRRLVDRFGDPETACAASLEELTSIPRLGPVLAERIRAVDPASLEAELYSLYDEGIDVLTLADPGYPRHLQWIPDAPPILFTRGTITDKDERSVSVVGSRRASPVGTQTSHNLAAALAEAGYTVVSGLARGIDMAAHQGALEAGGRTLAVLGSGIRVVQAAGSAELAREIETSGALLSELHPNAPPRGGTLMARDRIISGLSLGVIVVEAEPDSGSLDTAARARKQGRPVFAVECHAAGNQELLAGGAFPLDANAFDPLLLTEQLPTPAAPPDPPDQLSLFSE